MPAGRGEILNRKRFARTKAFTTYVVSRGYSDAGASYTRKSLKGFQADSGHPSEDIDFNNWTLRQRSRMLYMGAPIATGALRRVRTNVVGSGLHLKCAINADVLGLTEEEADEWQRHTEAEFALWASRKDACDATGVNDFYGMQQLALLSWLMSGDVFALVKRFTATGLTPYTLRLQLIEADRVRTPVESGAVLALNTTGKAANGNTIYDGVEVQANGRIVAYHVANTYPYQATLQPTEFQRIEAYGRRTHLPNILHVMDAERPEQYRGVPYLAQVMEPLLQMRRYTESELMAALVQSFFTAFVKTEAGSDIIPFNEVPHDDISRDPNEYELGPGTMNMLEPGEDIVFGNPSHPNTGFDVFMRAMCEQVGAALEIPADLLMMSFNSSYSASRAALLEAWKAFRMRREWLVKDFCEPVYELWLTEAVALGRISAPGFFADPLVRRAYLQADWIGPSAGQIDQTKEVQAAIMAIEAGLTTREAEAIKLNGSDYLANVTKLATENELLKEANGGSQQQEQPPLEEDNNTEDEEQEEGEDQNEESVQHQDDGDE